MGCLLWFQNLTCALQRTFLLCFTQYYKHHCGKLHLSWTNSWIWPCFNGNRLLKINHTNLKCTQFNSVLKEISHIYSCSDWCNSVIYNDFIDYGINLLCSQTFQLLNYWSMQGDLRVIFSDLLILLSDVNSSTYLSFPSIECLLYPRNMHLVHGLLCFVLVVFIHILQGYCIGTGAIIGLPQNQWSNPEESSNSNRFKLKDCYCHTISCTYKKHKERHSI